MLTQKQLEIIEKVKVMQTAAIERIQSERKSVVLSSDEVEHARQAALKFTEKSKRNHDYNADNPKQFDCYFSGLKAEMAVLKWLDEDPFLVDVKVDDPTKTYYCDLSVLGLRCGVKTSKFGQAAIIACDNFQDQVICVESESNHNQYYVLGVVDKYDARRNLKDEYIINYDGVKANNKSAFIGYERVHPFLTIEKLKKMI